MEFSFLAARDCRSFAALWNHMHVLTIAIVEDPHPLFVGTHPPSPVPLPSTYAAVAAAVRNYAAFAQVVHACLTFAVVQFTLVLFPGNHL